MKDPTNISDSTKKSFWQHMEKLCMTKIWILKYKWTPSYLQFEIANIHKNYLPGTSW